MARFLWVCLGGAIGTGARYLISGWLLRFTGPVFPWDTLTINAIGSFLLAFLMQVSMYSELLHPTARIALTTGVLGGFTTYSTFNYETLRFFQEDAWLLGLINLASTVTACLIAGVLGLLSGRLLTGG